MEKKASKSGNLPKEKRGGCSFDEKGGSAGWKRLFPQVNVFHAKEQQFLKEENAYE